MRFKKALDWFRLTGGNAPRARRKADALRVKRVEGRRVNSRPDSWPPTDEP